MTRKTRRTLLISISGAVLLALGVVAYEIREGIRDTRACAATEELLFNYASSHDYTWPRNWETLRPYHASWYLGPQQRVWAIPEFEDLRDRVTIDFSFDPRSLRRSAIPGTLPTPPSLHVLWPTRGEGWFRTASAANSSLEQKLRKEIDDVAERPSPPTPPAPHESPEPPEPPPPPTPASQSAQGLPGQAAP